jgi:succinate-semialdehyde dehydrogenase/glutarate-semialdehyde dehydrogenase
MKLQSINPATGRVEAEYERMPAEEIPRAVERAHETFDAWRRTSFGERSALFARVAAVLRERAEELARLMAREMGKPVRDGRAEIAKCALGCEHYAAHAESMLRPEEIKTDFPRSRVVFQPLGAILAVMPWNFPFWQVFRFAAPALMAGNVGLLKHASNVPGCARAIEEAMRSAGFPAGVFQSLLVGSEHVDALIDHPLVRAVTLTGSGAAGKAVARRAGERLKKTVLELGGSDPYVVLADANLDEAVSVCAAARLTNSGQSCIAAKRFVVVEPLRVRFESMLVERMRSRKVGDPLDESTEVGPLARRDLRDLLHRQVEKSVAMGATCPLGGRVPEGPGAYYPPTVLSGVRPGMPAYDEELFGPVAAIISARDELEAIRIANDTPFGLGAAVFTRDSARGERIAAEELEAGSCFVNASVRSDVRLPFGGIKESGYGRELSGYGIREFVNIKTVVVQG